MNSSKIYYQSLFQKIMESYYPIAKQDIIYDSSGSSVVDKVTEHQMIDDYYEWNNDILKNKREAKFLFKIHEEILGYYAEKIKHIDLKTQKTYSRIVSQFLAYSPFFDPDDLERF